LIEIREMEHQSLDSGFDM